MFASYRRSLLYLKSIRRTSPPIPSFYVLLQHKASIFGPNYSTSPPKKPSFTVNYLIRNCGFSLESALWVAERIHLKTSEKPDSVIELLKNCGFSDSQLRDIIRKAPRVLVCDPINTIWPKLDFLLSKGASCSLLVDIVRRRPGLLFRSLENHIIPSYNFVKRFLGSDKRTLTCVQRCYRVICDDRLKHNVKLLLDNGVLESGIAYLLYTWPSLLNLEVDDTKKTVEDVKELGLDPSKSVFIPAFCALRQISKSAKERKIDVYKKWGWSDEDINKAFVRHPHIMLMSRGKIAAGMKFFVSKVGWDSSVISRNPVLLSLSLEKRIIPRAAVLQFLQSKGLIKRADVLLPYYISEEKFLQKYVYSFMDEATQLLKLYNNNNNKPSLIPLGGNNVVLGYIVNHILPRWPRSFNSDFNGLKMALEEVTELGYDLTRSACIQHFDQATAFGKGSLIYTRAMVSSVSRICCESAVLIKEKED